MAKVTGAKKGGPLLSGKAVTTWALIAIIAVLLPSLWEKISSRERAENRPLSGAALCEEWAKQYVVIDESNFPIDTIRIGQEKRVGKIFRVGPREKWLLVLSDTVPSGVVEFRKDIPRWHFWPSNEMQATSLDYPPLTIRISPEQNPEWNLRRFFQFRGRGCVLLLGFRAVNDTR